MRIVFIITRSDTIGGAQVHVRDLSSTLLGQSHEVTVLTGGDGAYAHSLRERGIPCISLKHLVRSLRPWRDLRGVLEVRRTLQKIKPDLVSTHSAKAGWLGRIAARSLGIPVLYTAHGWSFGDGMPQGSARLYRRAERAVAPLSSHIITVSERDRELALEHRVARPEQLTAVHNGMPDSQPSVRANPGQQPPRLVMVARYEDPKDHKTLFHALSEIMDLEWRLDLVGDGPRWAEAEQLCRSLGLIDRINFLGLQQNVGSILQDSQIFLLISRSEGFPRSILEAMRTGLPVIASSVGGIPESVSDGETGILVPSGNVRALGEALRRLIGNPDLRLAMGSAGRARYERYFTFERMFGETFAIYQRILS